MVGPTSGNSVPSYHHMTKAERDALVDLDDARLGNPSPCQLEPWRWDDNTHIPVQRRLLIANESAEKCKTRCHALAQCMKYLAVSKAPSGVLAGQVFVKVPGRKPGTKTPATEPANER